MIIKILYKGQIIKRKIKPERMGNFVMNIVRIDNKEYLLGDGSEYLHGYDDAYDFSSLRFLRRAR
jgi:hypothetical protein